MHKIKVIRILKSLSSEEMRQLDKFVRSPIHNKHDDVINLFQYLRKEIKDGKELKKERVFHHLFNKNEAFDMQKVHHVSSYLLKVVEEFLAWSEWKKDPIEVNLYLTRSLSLHAMDKQFNNFLEKTRKLNESQSLRDARYFYKKYQLQFEEYNYARTLGRTRDFNLQELSDAQDIAYIVDKLKYASVLLSHQAVTKKIYDTGPLQLIIEFIENHRFLDIPAISIYYHVYKALSSQGNEESFAKLKQMLIDLSESFEIADLRDLYIFAINFCIKKLNTGDESYKREVFDIYLSGLKKDVFLDNGVFSPWTYSNIVQVGLMLNEFEIIEPFINDFRPYLPENKKEAYYCYNYAWFFYQKKNYKKAMQLLLRTDYGGDILIACTAKTLLARMYFEQKEMDSLLSLLQSFKVFIKRKRVIGYHRDPYLNFINIMHRVINMNKGVKEELEKIKQQVISAKNLAARDWLLENIGPK